MANKLEEALRIINTNPKPTASRIRRLLLELEEGAEEAERQRAEAATKLERHKRAPRGWTLLWPTEPGYYWVKLDGHVLGVFPFESVKHYFKSKNVFYAGPIKEPW